MGNSAEPGKYCPTFLGSSERTESRKDELAHPTLADFLSGGTPSGSNAGGIGIHIDVVRNNPNAESGFGCPAGPLLSQHVGIPLYAQLDLVLMDSVPVAYRQASQLLNFGDFDPVAGIYSVRYEPIQPGQWFWGPTAKPFGVRITHDARPRVTADGVFRVAPR